MPATGFRDTSLPGAQTDIIERARVLGKETVESCLSCRIVWDSQCQRFESKILQDALRFGTWVELPFMCCGQWKWKHWNCVSGKQIHNLQAAIYSPDGDVYDWVEIEEFDEFTEFPELEAKVRRVVAQGHVDDDFNGEPMCNKPGRIGIRQRGIITPSLIKSGPIIIPVVPVPTVLDSINMPPSPMRQVLGASLLSGGESGTALSSSPMHKPTFVITGIFSAMTPDEAEAMAMSIGGVRVESERDHELCSEEEADDGVFFLAAATLNTRERSHVDDVEGKTSRLTSNRMADEKLRDLLGRNRFVLLMGYFLKLAKQEGMPTMLWGVTRCGVRALVLPEERTAAVGLDQIRRSPGLLPLR
ncbi:hypothetical protein PG993_006741 [Apiospora rasikravindrae]|uniref:PARP-type domain-containing protein n=1 Tax=Apiospora rasikravindrae TaxID=990691 RepID=A0ABR1T6I4_9PEZI